MRNRITQLFGIRYPIIQAGMVWVSGHKLASAVSNAGGLGLIGAGSMYPDVLREHIRKCKKETSRPFGVNIPLFYPDLEEILDEVDKECRDERGGIVNCPCPKKAQIRGVGRNHAIPATGPSANQ